MADNEQTTTDPAPQETQAQGQAQSGSAAMIPSVGRIVHYKLGEHDLKLINKRMSNLNRHEQGQILPMLIVKTWGDTPESAVNGRVFLDGQHDLWVTSRKQGTGLSQWSDPKAA